MSSSNIVENTEKHKRQLDRILSFANGEYIDMPITSKADPNSKTITTSTIQGGTRTTTTRLKPVRKLTFIEELDKVLSLGAARY
ncbi:MAG: hypothetical protein ACRD8W_02130 [Nitrososphaeraceae archaeon]